MNARRGMLPGLLPLGIAVAWGGISEVGAFGPETDEVAADYVRIDARSEPLRSAFNAQPGKVRILALVSPTCGGCLRGAEQLQERLLEEIGSSDLAVHVVWVPRNGARERHVDRVTRLVTDGRAVQYWDATGAVIDPFDEMLNVTGPCAGMFLLYGPEATWVGDGPPAPLHWEDAHARELNRNEAHQLDIERFAERTRELLRREAAGS